MLNCATDCNQWTVALTEWLRCDISLSSVSSGICRPVEVRWNNVAGMQPSRFIELLRETPPAILFQTKISWKYRYLVQVYPSLAMATSHVTKSSMDVGIAVSRYFIQVSSISPKNLKVPPPSKPSLFWGSLSAPNVAIPLPIQNY